MEAESEPVFSEGKLVLRDPLPPFSLPYSATSAPRPVGPQWTGNSNPRLDGVVTGGRQEARFLLFWLLLAGESVWLTNIPKCVWGTITPQRTHFKGGLQGLWMLNPEKHIVIQSLRRVRLFATPWMAAGQASLSLSFTWSLCKFRSIESVMPSSHLILCCLLLLLPSVFPTSGSSPVCRWEQSERKAFPALTDGPKGQKGWAAKSDSLLWAAQVLGETNPPGPGIFRSSTTLEDLSLLSLFSWAILTPAPGPCGYEGVSGRCFQFEEKLSMGQKEETMSVCEPEWTRGEWGRAGRLQYAPAGSCGQPWSPDPHWYQSPWQRNEVKPESAIERRVGGLEGNQESSPALMPASGVSLGKSLSGSSTEKWGARLTRTCKASLVTQTVKNLPAKQETQVQSLGWEDPLEKGMATHSIILAWEIPWTE